MTDFIESLWITFRFSTILCIFIATQAHLFGHAETQRYCRLVSDGGEGINFSYKKVCHTTAVKIHSSFYMVDEAIESR
jgi:hypothetical protein